MCFCPVVSSSFSSSFFFLAWSRPSQTGCLPCFHAWCGLGANLGCGSGACCTRLAESAGRKNRQRFAMCAPSHTFVGLCLLNWGAHRQSRRDLLGGGISPARPRSVGNFGPLAAGVGSLVWGAPAGFNGFRVLASLLPRSARGATCVGQGGRRVGRRPTF